MAPHEASWRCGLCGLSREWEKEGREEGKNSEEGEQYSCQRIDYCLDGCLRALAVTHPRLENLYSKRSVALKSHRLEQ